MIKSPVSDSTLEWIKVVDSHDYCNRQDSCADAANNRDPAVFAAEYYLLNLVRLTTLPFLHAIWTGMAGYFIGFAEQFPERKRGLIIVAIGVPAFLHGSYNTFSAGAVGLIIALVSVLALNLYLAKSVDFEKLLAERRSQ